MKGLSPENIITKRNYLEKYQTYDLGILINNLFGSISLEHNNKLDETVIDRGVSGTNIIDPDKDEVDDNLMGAG